MHPFATTAADSVSALGEEKLIAAIRRWLGSASPRAPFGIGDDCAVLPASRHRQLITVDPVIYPRHFNDAVPPSAVGAKLLKRNLSDLAAMGGRPTAAVLALQDAYGEGLAKTFTEAFESTGGTIAECARAVRVAGAVLFSATLNPPDYYRNLLGLGDTTPWLDIASPFEAAQRKELKVSAEGGGKVVAEPASDEELARLNAVLLESAEARAQLRSWAATDVRLRELAADAAHAAPVLPGMRESQAGSAKSASWLDRVARRGARLPLAAATGS